MLLFILGLPRSGTHLLRFTLDKSPDIQFVPETAVLYKYWGSRTLRRIFGRHFVARVLARMMVTSLGDPTMAEFTSREVNLAKAATAVPTLTTTFSLLQAFFDTPSRYLGEKSPNNTLFIRDVLATADGDEKPKLVLMQRDPHDQIASSVRTHHIGGGLIPALARHSAYHAAIEGIDCYRVKYETLIRHPEPTVRALCNHLGIDFLDAMLTPGILDSSEGESFFQRGEIGFLPDSLGKGRDRLGPEASELVDRFLAQGAKGLALGDRMRFYTHLALLRRNQTLARWGLVLLKSLVKARIGGLDAAVGRKNSIQ